jgi:hypothetical protein
MVADDLFEQPKPANRWSSQSIQKMIAGYGVWTSWNDFCGHLYPDCSPASLVTRENVELYVAALSGICSSYTIFCRVQELYDAIRVMAPDHDWSWLLVAVNNLRSWARPARNKLQRLKPANAIEELGFDLMRRADTQPDASLFKRALLFRDGLAIALLIRRPLRIGNFSAMKTGIHIVGNAPCRHIVFAAHEMKGKRRFEVDFPANLELALSRYLGTYRPYLLLLRRRCPAANPALWISNVGNAIDKDAFSKRIAKRTREAFGVDLTPHLFRDASVTTLVRDAPASALLTKSIMGHASIEITNKHYNQAKMVESAVRHSNLIDALTQTSDREGAA